MDINDIKLGTKIICNDFKGGLVGYVGDIDFKDRRVLIEFERDMGGHSGRIGYELKKKFKDLHHNCWWYNLCSVGHGKDKRVVIIGNEYSVELI